MTLLGAKKSKIDLLARYSYDPVQHEKKMRTLMYVVPGAALVLILVALVLVNLFKGISLDNDISDYESKIASLESSMDGVLDLKKINRQLRADLDMLEESEEKASKQSARYDYLSSKLLSEINAACGGKAEIKLMDYSDDGILFTFQTTAQNNRDISGIVKNIENIEYFKTVVYTGYSRVENDGYSFSVVCTFDVPQEESEAAQ